MGDLWAVPEFSQWSVGELLGEGGMGLVYRASDRASGAQRAIKVIRPELASANPQAAARFVREMRICESLIHPNVVRCYATGVANGTYFIVMDFCESGSLADLVERDGPLPAQVAVPLFLGILDGLHYAHTAPVEARTDDAHPVSTLGVVHRDIKPENILLTPDSVGGRIARIADFGLAKAYETAGLSGLTDTGTASGTPEFMPRRQVLNFKYALPDVDVWATAATLYYALTGATVRTFIPGRDRWLTVCTEPPVPIASRGVPVPPELAAVVDRAVLDDAEQGPAYVTAEEFRTALTRVSLSS